jgi:heme A synthase
MAHISLEFVLMLGYAISLALIALLLEWAAGHAHRRSRGVSTAGFTYHPDRDIWRCPRDQHLFPIFSDSAKGVVIYRAPASACNSCKSKAACTDSNHGREIERRDLNTLEHGMQQFHRAVSLTLLVLASLILVVELFRTGSLYPRIALLSVLMLLCLIVQRLSSISGPSMRAAPFIAREQNK